MANITLGYPNYIDDSTLSGGSWLSALPLTNIQTRYYREVARSTNLTASNTKLVISLGASKSIGVIGFITNISRYGQIRIKTSDTTDFTSPIYNSDWFDAYPALPQGSSEWSYEWGDDEFWSGRISEDRRQYYPNFVYHTFVANRCKYIQIEFDDTSNPDGYIDVGRIFVSGRWRIEVNPSYGSGFGNDCDTRESRSYGGISTFQKKPIARTFEGELQFLSEQQAFGRIFDVVRRQGKNDEIIFIYDEDETRYILEQSFPAVLIDQLPGATTFIHELFSAKFKLRELI